MYYFLKKTTGPNNCIYTELILIRAIYTKSASEVEILKQKQQKVGGVPYQAEFY